jgi:hypothetical protein
VRNVAIREDRRDIVGQLYGFLGGPSGLIAFITTINRRRGGKRGCDLVAFFPIQMIFQIAYKKWVLGNEAATKDSIIFDPLFFVKTSEIPSDSSLVFHPIDTQIWIEILHTFVLLSHQIDCRITCQRDCRSCLLN